ncbi:glucan beta-glucosidase Bgl2 (predicted) [Planoprotostelium fungivorum]|uniref:glucan endo-1,3-beta-D-glucosidase n=1 Tax=Planoprotostelium fungivorum TaxID=1890364 RepID=A0A2P6MWI6_9EUKA|nr:glucan beta-glucosidase Bgl2 (predicted) [Planoprotostelium fungivorum]
MRLVLHCTGADHMEVGSARSADFGKPLERMNKVCKRPRAVPLNIHTLRPDSVSPSSTRRHMLEIGGNIGLHSKTSVMRSILPNQAQDATVLRHMRTITILLILSILGSVTSQTLYGVAYGIDFNNCPSDAQLRNDITIISTFSQRVRVYGCFYCGNICLKIARIAQPLGLKLLLGVTPAPDSVFQNEKNAIGALASSEIGLNPNTILGITVGSEALYRGDLTSAQLAALVNNMRSYVRGLGSSVPIGTADTYFKFDATIVAAVDVLYMNVFPYWQGVADPVQGATIALQAYDSVVAIAQGKPVIIGETNWPTGGPSFGAAAATLANQAAYLPSLNCRAQDRNIGVYIYAAFDAWTGGTTTPEDNFGVYTTQRTRKSSFSYTCGPSVPPSQTTPQATVQGCRDMYKSLTCRTLNEDPAKMDAAAVSGARSWLCNANAQFCTTIQPGALYGTCNAVEQLSYAMNLWYSLYKPQQGDAACNFGGIGHVVAPGNTDGQLPPVTGNPTGNPSTVPATTASNSACQTMFGSLQCRTPSEDPAQANAAAISNARSWLCGTYPKYCTDIGTGGKYSGCNSVEQLSYAMNLYYKDFSSQGASACSFGGVGRLYNASSTTGQSTNPPPTTSGQTSCQTMFSSLKCRTSSENPASFDAASITNARNWLCGTYPQYCTAIGNGGTWSGCNSVEQLSYGMNLYYQQFAATQGSQACNFGGIGKVY